jgi:hypothetical protein
MSDPLANLPSRNCNFGTFQFSVTKFLRDIYIYMYGFSIERFFIFTSIRRQDPCLTSVITLFQSFLQTSLIVLRFSLLPSEQCRTHGEESQVRGGGREPIGQQGVPQPVEESPRLTLTPLFTVPARFCLD